MPLIDEAVLLAAAFEMEAVSRWTQCGRRFAWWFP